MNLKSIFSVVALSALMVGCSSDDLTNEPGAVETPAGVSETGYLNVCINLPTVNARDARSNANDQFNDGEPSEYAVKSAHLVIFNTDDETDPQAKIEGVFQFNSLKPWNTDGTSTDNVTTKAESVVKVQVPVPAEGKKLGALVVLNDDNFSSHFGVGMSLKNFFEEARLCNLANMKNSNGFLMMNAPLYVNGTAKTLVSVAKSDLCKSENEARDKTALEVYVERGVAKVTMTSTNDIAANSKVTIEGNKYVATIQNWALDITNKKTYLIRNVKNFGTWNAFPEPYNTRFFSETSKRIYWCEDPNYNFTPETAEDKASWVSTQFDKLASTDAITNTLNQSVYVLENTFNVQNQYRYQTTRAIIKASFAPEGEEPADFYTIGTASTIYDKADMQEFIKGKAISLFADKNDKTKYKFAPLTSVSETGGTHTIEVGDISYKIGDTYVDLTSEEIGKLNDVIGNINTYKGGICYYVARIKHFGDDLTPLAENDIIYGDEPTASHKFLGRYGIVRNNWYELQVSAIKTLGHPTIPDAPNTPDDEKDFYISFKVNIHSWAKRVQNVIL